MTEPRADLLIVDDTPDNLRLLTNMLKQQGYKVRGARSGESTADRSLYEATQVSASMASTGTLVRIT
jgi:CheY-like chemotaxis protein